MGVAVGRGVGVAGGCGVAVAVAVGVAVGAGAITTKEERRASKSAPVSPVATQPIY